MATARSCSWSGLPRPMDASSSVTATRRRLVEASSGIVDRSGENRRLYRERGGERQISPQRPARGVADADDADGVRVNAVEDSIPVARDRKRTDASVTALETHLREERQIGLELLDGVQES